MSSTTECRHEGAAGRDFCPRCGAYLAWTVEEEPTRELARGSNGEHGENGENGENGTVAFADQSTIVWQEHGGILKPSDGEPELQTRLAAISLRDDVRPEEPIEVQAGERVKVHVRVRNQSKIVDEFILAVVGLDDGWWDIQPPDLYLLPFGVGRRSSYEEEATVTLKPPRTSRATAKKWPIRITATSKATGDVAAEVALDLKVLPYPEVQLTVEPHISIGRRGGDFELSVTNDGNDTTSVLLTGSSEAEDCRLTFEPNGLVVPAGGTKTAKVTAKAKPHPVGRPVDHVLTLKALPAGSDVPPQPGPFSLHQQLFALVSKPLKKAAGAEVKQAKKQAPKAPKAPKGASEALKALGLKAPAAPSVKGASATAPAAQPQEAEAEDKTPSCTCTYRQRSSLPWWTAVLAAIALAVLAYFAWQWIHREAVPNVKGDFILLARSEVSMAHLDGVEHAAVPTNGYDKWGRVFEEMPKPKTKIWRNHRVLLLTAVNPHRTKMPDLFGLTPVPAEKLLSSRGFAIGTVKPDPWSKGLVIVQQSIKLGKRVRLKKVGRVWQAQAKVVNVTLGEAAAVPLLVGEGPAAADQMLRGLGLVLGSIRQQAPHWVRATPVIATQAPIADKTVLAGTEVDVKLGLPVPKVKGQHLLQARRLLHSKGMWLGALSPAHPSAADVVVRANPAAGTVVPFGTHVAFSLAAPPKKKSKAKKKKAKTAAGAAKPVPSVAGASAAAAAAAIAKVGDKTRTTYAVSATVPAGRLLSTVPKAGAKVAKGKTITLVISAGYPEIAADNGHGIVTLNGVTGKIVTHVVSGPLAATASEPSWSPSGTDIAYVSSGRIMLTPANGPAGPKALTGSDATFVLPTFPSTPTAPDVLAAVGVRGGVADELCLLTVSQPRASCVIVSGWSLGDEIAWSPNGTELLVGASSSSSPATFGLMEFTSKTPFSTRAKDWGSRRLVTPTMGGSGVRAAAFSPNGAQLALAEDLGAPFSLALVAPSDLMLTKADVFPAPSPACSVQWRADSQDVLVQTSSAANCSAALGSIYTVNPAHPRALSLLATGVGDAAWQPLPGVG